MHTLPSRIIVGAHPRHELLAAGVTDYELRRGLLWRQVQYGRYTWSATGPPAVDQRIRCAAALVRGRGAVGGWAAARLLGARAFDGEGADGEPLPVPLCLSRSARCRGGRGVVVLRSDLAPAEVVRVGDIPVTGPVRTCVDLARLVAPWQEAVVAVDALLSAGLGLGDLGILDRDVRDLGIVDRETHDLDLRAEAGRWLDTHPGRRGVPQARRVLAWSRECVRSPQESRLRLLWRGDAGLPDPLVNTLLAGPDGRVLCEPDLLDPACGLVAEYDGEVHGGARRRGADEQRRDRMRRAGLTLVVVTATGLGSGRAGTAQRLRVAHAEATDRRRRRDWRVTGSPRSPGAG